MHVSAKCKTGGLIFRHEPFAHSILSIVNRIRSIRSTGTICEPWRNLISNGTYGSLVPRVCAGKDAFTICRNLRQFRIRNPLFEPDSMIWARAAGRGLFELWQAIDIRVKRRTPRTTPDRESLSRMRRSAVPTARTLLVGRPASKKGSEELRSPSFV
jgi:hypothetical protein